ncbi:hypothetical protein A0H76_1529 [Hepatospora eriocheir]|uniref:Uncharacterized protein n=1 Tax=Hepatospora eriocheir TaxID=1081669 RepID=A0A1X0QGX2_9MICR|nr:hypothetical protein A0H76_1529 [Hepatospora eriocheir]
MKSALLIFIVKTVLTIGINLICDEHSNNKKIANEQFKKLHDMIQNLTDKLENNPYFNLENENTRDLEGTLGEFIEKNNFDSNCEGPGCPNEETIEKLKELCKGYFLQSLFTDNEQAKHPFFNNLCFKINEYLTGKSFNNILDAQYEANNGEESGYTYEGTEHRFKVSKNVYFIHPVTKEKIYALGPISPNPNSDFFDPDVFFLNKNVIIKPINANAERDTLLKEVYKRGGYLIKEIKPAADDEDGKTGGISFKKIGISFNPKTRQNLNSTHNFNSILGNRRSKAEHEENMKTIDDIQNMIDINRKEIDENRNNDNKYLKEQIEEANKINLQNKLDQFEIDKSANQVANNGDEARAMMSS